jgi:signal transduction histidine kinase
MTLGLKILWRNLALFAGLVLLGVTTMSGLRELRQTAQRTLQENEGLRTIHTVQVRTADARRRLSADPPDVAGAVNLLRSAVNDLQKLTVYRVPSSAPGAVNDHYDDWARNMVYGTVPPIVTVLRDLDSPGKPPADLSEQIAQLDDGVRRLERAFIDCQGFIGNNQQLADLQLRATLTAVIVLSSLILLGAVATSLFHYRGIIRPLTQLRNAVGKLARADFSGELPPGGKSEFAQLTVDFNRMASELRGLYEELERKVEAKSRELLRSQRLASVGYLAAGVSHEINNPLSIMSGYAELTLKSLEKGYDEASAQGAIEALRVIRDEAFRCKQITGKLLSMARAGGDSKEVFSLADVAGDVTRLLAGLEPYHGRHVELKFDSPQGTQIYGNINEMKQVLLNLAVNALQAVKPKDGQVKIEGRRLGEWVEISVADNGRGMTPETIEQVFEPFFTDKRGVSEPGTGLGLAITHAIVESHGGQIRAESAGLGRGSRFVVRLPARDSSEGKEAGTA